jgi:cold shock CspA family protein
MNATIQQIHRDRGTGSLVAEDGKTYMFRRNSVRDGWFHDLSEGATVSFEPAEPPGKLEAVHVKLIRSAPVP